MANSTKEIMSKTYGNIAAIDTIANNFPQLISVESLLQLTVGSTLEMILQILQICGVQTTEIMNWISKILSGEILYDYEGKAIEKAASDIDNTDGDSKFASGLLDTLEISIKTILLANLKDLFGGCPIDPILPDYIMMRASNEPAVPNATGLELPLETIDFFGILKNCPCDSDGSVFYMNDSHIENNVNETWKSFDFNKFLWFVVNKGNLSTSKHKNTWDNRTSYLKPYKEGNISSTDMDAFLNASNINGNYAFITKKNDEYKTITKNTILTEDAPEDNLFVKKQIVLCEYQEQTNNNTSNIIKLWANADRYYKTNGPTIKGKKYGINKTIFEFNYDYVTSIKLFDSKTIVANVLNTLFSLTNTIRPVMDINYAITQIKIEEIINKVLEYSSDENNINNDYYSFSNEEYDRMLSKANKRLKGQYIDNIGNNNIDYNAIINGIKKIDTSSNQTEAINNVLKLAAESVSQAKYDINGDIRFKLDYSFILDLLKQCIVQIVMQLMTPKLTMLYAVNMAVMGDISDVTGWKNNFKYTFSSIDNTLEALQNLITSIIKEVIKEFINQLTAFLVTKLKEWIEKFSMDIIMEAIKDYKDLLFSLIENCVPIIPLFYNQTEPMAIDNVYQADIIPENLNPVEVSKLKIKLNNNVSSN